MEVLHDFAQPEVRNRGVGGKGHDCTAALLAQLVHGIGEVIEGRADLAVELRAA